MYDKRLDTFVTIAELGSFSKAADILYLSVPALTKQISALEKEYGFTLFTRDARGAHLTKAGLSLYKDAKDLFNVFHGCFLRHMIFVDIWKLLICQQSMIFKFIPSLMISIKATISTEKSVFHWTESLHC